MKKIFSLIFISAASLLSFQAAAQSYRYANEALTFSRIGVTGTARIQGMGGAQTSLGGDISSAFSNPAGLGFYNRSEVSFSPSYFSSANDAVYLGSANNYNYKTNINISNFGIVLAGNKRNERGWLGGNFALSYQRTNNFNDKFNYRGTNPNNGMIDVLVDNYATETPDLLTDLAYATYLVGEYNYVDENGNPIYSLAFSPTAEFPVIQEETVERRGSQSQFNLSYGGNINDKFYIGAGIGLTSIEYRMDKRYSENFMPDDDVPSFDIIESQTLLGSGINATLGFIARPTSFLTLGISYATPTIYSLEEDYSTELTVNYNNVLIDDEVLLDYEGDPVTLTSSTDGEVSTYNFNLRTPGKLSVGSSFFFGKNGLLTADVEFMNYTKNRLTDDQNYVDEDNLAIQEDFTSTVNLKLGGEYRFDIFRIRAGFAHLGDPYSNRDGWDRFNQTFTGGAGLRFKNYFVDLAVTHQMGERYYYPYSYGSESPLVSIDNRTTQGILTLGLNF